MNEFKLDNLWAICSFEFSIVLNPFLLTIDRNLYVYYNYISTMYYVTMCYCQIFIFIMFKCTFLNRFSSPYLRNCK